MVGPPRLNRRNAQVIRSQFALELVLSALAVVSAFVILRLVFKLLSITDRAWTGGLVYGLTEQVVWPLSLLPGANRAFMGAATLKEVTAAAVVMMLPLILIGRNRDRRA